MGPFTSFSEVRSAILRQAWLILLILAVGLPAVYWYVKGIPKVYEASGVIGLEGPRANLGDQFANPNEVGVAQRLDEIQQALLSRTYLKELAEQFELFPEAENEATRLAMVRYVITFNRLVDPSQAWRNDAQPYGLSIGVRLEDPDATVTMANALLDAAVAVDAERERARQGVTLGRMDAILATLASEESRIGAEIAEVEARIADYRTAHADSLPENLPNVRERLSSLLSQSAALERDISGLQRTQADRPSSIAERHRADLEAMRQDLLSQIAAAQASIAAAAEVERELGALTRHLRSLETELSAIVTQRTEAQMSQGLVDDSQGTPFAVLETALPPEYPTGPSRRKVALAGAAAVAGLALGLALARELLHPVIRTASQMQKQLNLEPVVAIPYLKSPWSARHRLTQGVLLGAIFLVLLLGPASLL